MAGQFRLHRERGHGGANIDNGYDLILTVLITIRGINQLHGSLNAMGLDVDHFGLKAA